MDLSVRALMTRVAGLIGRTGVAGSPDRPATVDEMLPPSRLFSVGKGDFKAIGRAILEELKRSCGLAAQHRVLDVGCGTGRVAIPLTQYLSPQGGYEGFDPVRKAIEHCRTRITPSYPNFQFQVADLYSRRYNPRGRHKDSEYRFPYPDASFDLVIAASVFTHLLPEGTTQYVAESARVLKPGGHFFATWFLLNEDSIAAVEAGRSSISLRRRFTEHWVHNPRVPEAAVAYDERFVVRLYETCGLELKQPAGYGSWSGRGPSGYDGYQDALVAVRQTRP